MIDRRRFAAAVGGLAATSLARPALAAAAFDGGSAFSRTTVDGLARSLAAKPYAGPAAKLPDTLAGIDYRDYTGMRFKSDKALWLTEKLPFQVQLFPRGYLYSARVDVFEVADGKARPVVYAPAMFEKAGTIDPGALPADLGFSGFRLHAQINSQARFEEFAVFQGASYFRAAGKNQFYGLSARGLAIGAGAPGEEFPIFRSFWLERPAPGADHLVVHALLDSPSVTGAYSFLIRPGVETVFDVDATLYPRKEIAHAGLSPMSSMYYSGDIDRWRRPQAKGPIHDSEGLAIWNGKGERLWRSLENPAALQADAFLDARPKGFGLIQRHRLAADYGEAQEYEKRPSLWIEPKTGFEAGSVQLVQIPTTDANADNIAAFWAPARPLTPGRPVRVAYRLRWGSDGASAPKVAEVFDVRRKGPQDLAFEVDFKGDVAGLAPLVTASAGAVKAVALNPMPGGARLAFELEPASATTLNLRARLERNGAATTETWLYRWTR